MHHRIRSADKQQLAAAVSGTAGGKDGVLTADDCFDLGFETWTVAYATPTVHA